MEAAANTAAAAAVAAAQEANNTAAASVSAAAAATKDISSGRLVKDAKDRFTEQDKRASEQDARFNNFMAKMKEFETQVLTDQNLIRDKIKEQANRLDEQMTDLNRKFAGIFQTIEGQAAQIKGVQDTIHALSTRMDSFIDQQVQQLQNNQQAQAAAAAAQAEIMKTLATMQKQDRMHGAEMPKGAPADKTGKVEESS